MATEKTYIQELNPIIKKAEKAKDKIFKEYYAELKKLNLDSKTSKADVVNKIWEKYKPRFDKALEKFNKESIKVWNKHNTK